MTLPNRPLPWGWLSEYGGARSAQLRTTVIDAPQARAQASKPARKGDKTASRAKKRKRKKDRSRKAAANDAAVELMRRTARGLRQYKQRAAAHYETRKRAGQTGAERPRRFGGDIDAEALMREIARKHRADHARGRRR